MPQNIKDFQKNADNYIARNLNQAVEMVNLDIDMELLAKYAYLIQGQGIGKTQGANQAEEAEGVEGANGAQGTKFYRQKGYSPKNLVEDLDLRDPKVRYAIIKEMKQADVLKLLPLLSKKALLNGMNFFTRDKLSTLLSYLPEELLAKVCQNMFTPKQMIELMPLRAVQKFLTNKKIDKNNIMKYMNEEMKPQELKDMYMQATGRDIGTNNKEEMSAKICSLKPNMFKDAIYSMHPKHAKGMAALVLKEQPELTAEFSSTQMSMCFDKCMKGEIIKGLSVLETEDLSKVLENLPPQLIEQVVTQIDPEIFADQLLNQMSDVLDRMQL